MVASGGIIKSAMAKRGFRHRRTEDQFTTSGQYARNLQYVYSKEYAGKSGVVVDLVYFAVNIVGEKLVIGLYREETGRENGIYINASRSIYLIDFSAEAIDKELDKLIPAITGSFK